MDREITEEPLKVAGPGKAAGQGELIPVHWNYAWRTRNLRKWTMVHFGQDLGKPTVGT